jgi:hypothetical protein
MGTNIWCENAFKTVHCEWRMEGNIQLDFRRKGSDYQSGRKGLMILLTD